MGRHQVAGVILTRPSRANVYTFTVSEVCIDQIAAMLKLNIQRHKYITFKMVSVCIGNGVKTLASWCSGAAEVLCLACSLPVL